MHSYYVLWSGGLDSTYLTLRLLETGNIVKVGYVCIDNNETKSKMEMRAIAKIVPKIEKLYPNFHYDGKIYKAHNFNIKYRNLKYRQVPYFLHSLLVAPHTDYRAVGYVQGDSSIKHIDDIRNIYNSYERICNTTLPSLIFPLKHISKEEIIRDFSSRYLDIMKHCVWCSKPNLITLSHCNKCAPCVRFNQCFANVKGA